MLSFEFPVPPFAASFRAFNTALALAFFVLCFVADWAAATALVPTCAACFAALVALRLAILRPLGDTGAASGPGPSLG